ncbi:MAG: hypothetical protein K0Q95_2561 [Bacteroidota bacterium]|jgi:hypothetical protein|nr:hypothetical protein [Bacteroidota bacterium]
MDKPVNRKRPYYSFIHPFDNHLPNDTFYDPAEFSWTSLLEKNHDMIAAEVTRFINKNERALRPYFASALMDNPASWKALSFYFWGKRMDENACLECPDTLGILSQIPNIVSASISILEPHSEIKGHFGDTDAIYRCHLGLVIPASLPECGFRVGYEDRPWQTGKLLIFNDANYHRAWNKSGERRIILLFDVIKPEYASEKKIICAKIHGNIMWQKISEFTGLYKNKKNFITKGISTLNFTIAWLRLHFLNRKSAWL